MQHPIVVLATKLLFILVTITLVLLNESSTQAQRSANLQAYTHTESNLNLKFMLGLVGDVETETPIGDVDDDLEPTFGGGLEIDFPLHKYFMLGGMFSFHAWITEEGEEADLDRGYLLDFSIVPKVRYPFEDTILAIYLGVPVGLCIDLVDDDNFTFPGVEVEADVGLGLNVSVLAGVQANLSRSFGLMLELGYTYHSFDHDADTTVFGVSDEIDVDVAMDEFALNIGFYFLI